MKVFLFVIMFVFAELSATTLHVRAELPPSDTWWTGQRITVRLYVLASEQPRRNPRLGPLEMPGAIVALSQGSPTYHQEERDGITFKGRILDIECFPQKAGILTLAPIEVIQQTDVGELRGTSNSLDLTVRRPQGTEGFGLVPSTRALSVKQAWSNFPEEAHVGDSLQRTITWRAEDILAMALPSLPVQEQAGMRIYRGKSLPEDTLNRGQLIGGRKDVFTHVFEGPGVYELPTIRVPWFDLKSERLMFHELPGRSISVAAVPVPTSPDDAKQGVRGGLALLVSCIGLGLGCLIWWARQGKARAQQTHEVEMHHLVLRALRQNDYDQVHHATLRWVASLTVSEAQWALASLKDDILSMSRYRFGGGPTPDLKLFKKHLMALRQPVSIEDPPLNEWR